MLSRDWQRLGARGVGALLVLSLVLGYLAAGTLAGHRTATTPVAVRRPTGGRHGGVTHHRAHRHHGVHRHHHADHRVAREAESAADVAPAPAGAALAREAGQMIAARMPPGPMPDAAFLDRIRRGEIGAVILFGDNIVDASQVSQAVAAMQQAASAGGNPALLVMTDQEGGSVKRFPAAPPTLSPAAMGASANAAGVAQQQGFRASGALRAVGIDVDLAPVADVPTSSASFLGDRAYGRSPGQVTQAACGFAAGLAQGGVHPTLKHFPGLGAAAGNTDLQPVTITASRTLLRADWQPYLACSRPVGGGSGLVMVSNAAYPALDASGTPAVLSSRIIRTDLRRVVGFQGVTISDDLQAPGRQGAPAAAPAVARAGIDLLLYSSTAQASAAAYAQLVRSARADPATRAAVRGAAGRIAALKAEG